MSPPPFPPLPKLIGIPEKLLDALSSKAVKTEEFQQAPPVNKPAVPTGEFTLSVYLTGAPTESINRLARALSNSYGYSRISLVDMISISNKQKAFKQACDKLETDWMIWIDGTTLIRRNNWLDALQETIYQSPEAGGIGLKLSHTLRSGKADPRNWFKKAPWYKGVHLRSSSGAEFPNGDSIHYPNPGFFALSREAISNCGIPDERLSNCGLELVIGEQLHQGGYELRSFDHQEEFIKTSSAVPCNYPWELADL
jgi:hypothetical protein